MRFPVEWLPEFDRPSGPALVGLAGLFPVGWWLWGLPGIAAAGALALVGLAVAPATLFAAAHVLLAALPPSTAAGLVAFELAVGLVLFGDPGYRRGLTPVPVVAAGLFVGFAWAALRLAGAESTAIAAGALLGGIGLAGYAIHRYELVRLGLVDAEAVRVTGDGRPEGDD